MKTKEKEQIKKPRYLRDDIAHLILMDEDCRGYVERVVSKALDIDPELLKNSLILKSPRVNTNIETKYSTVDALFEHDTCIINIEINYNKGKLSKEKICDISVI